MLHHPQRYEPELVDRITACATYDKFKDLLLDLRDGGTLARVAGKDRTALIIVRPRKPAGAAAPGPAPAVGAAPTAGASTRVAAVKRASAASGGPLAQAAQKQQADGAEGRCGLFPCFELFLQLGLRAGELVHIACPLTRTHVHCSCSDEAVGRRVSVFWPQENEWCACCVRPAERSHRGVRGVPPTS